MESELLDAANEGSVGLLQQDVLQRYMAERLKQTPLHIAAMKGHLEFTKGVLATMPEMANELDSRKSSPLHVATARGRIPIVKELLSKNPDMCFAKDCEGRNPLHMAIIKGHIDILEELLVFEAQAARALLGSPTILHLCVKHHHLEALKCILKFCQKRKKCILEVFPDDAEFVNSKDEKGLSILHLAVAEKQTEVVKFLLQEHGKIDVNARNANGFTAWDISLTQDRTDSKTREVAECLQQARDCCGTGLLDKFKNLCSSIAKEDPREKKKFRESCNALMIAASIITTVTFQALIQPPDKIENKSDDYQFFNTLSFSATVGVLLLLISGFPLKNRILIWILRITMWIAVLSAAFVIFIVADVVFWNANTRFYAAVIVAWAMVILIFILTVGHAIRIIIKTVKCLRKRSEDRKRRANLKAQGESRV